MEQTKFFQKHIKTLIMNDIRNNPNFTEHIIEPTTYALNSGKRLRPAILLSIAGFQLVDNDNDNDNDNDIMNKLALFIEYVHNVSLIIDDLPCMDNDLIRRGLPTVHAKYGEHIAQLISLNLMVSAYHHSSNAIYKKSISYEISKAIAEEVNECLSFRGITGGQHMDLSINKDIELLSEREQKEKIMILAKLKTGYLFGLSFQLGWFAKTSESGCNDEYIISSMKLMKDAGISFGICYQIIDDLNDMVSDMEKNNGYNNICRYFTRNEIIDLFSYHISCFQKICNSNGTFTQLLNELYTFLIESFKKNLVSFS